MARANINKVFVVGTVQEVKSDIYTTTDGRRFISGKVIIKSEINGADNLVDVKFLAFEKTKTGEDSKMFATYSKLEGNLNKRVRITAELRDGNMVDQSNGSVRHFNEVWLKFINPARVDDVDQATFEYSGFVAKPLYERKNKDDELVGYRIEVGQENWNASNMNLIRFDVHKDDVNIASVIEANYETGSTVSFSGNITYITTVETKTEEVAFGEPVVKQFAKTDKMFRITGGNAPLDEDNPLTYPMDEIKKLVAAYKEADVERVAAKAAQVASAETNSVATAMGSITRSSARAGSLL